MSWCSFELQDNLGTLNVSVKENQILFKSPCSSSFKCTPYIINLKKGHYAFEAWGSSGKTAYDCMEPGKGAYVKGEIFLPNETKLYAHIGTTFYGSTDIDQLYNGAPGGGATDVRVVGGEWGSFDSMKSRILVAAGGGGCEWPAAKGGHGGKLEGGIGYGCSFGNSKEANESIFAHGGTQKDGGETAMNVEFDGHVKNGAKGTFWKSGFSSSNDKGGIGGGGYYGGGSFDYAGAGGGGSSFVSGCDGCIAISNQSTNFDNVIPDNKSQHYSYFIFHNIDMRAGNTIMPLYDHYTTADGNNAEGALRITILDLCLTLKRTLIFKIHCSMLFDVIFCSWIKKVINNKEENLSLLVW